MKISHMDTTRYRSVVGALQHLSLTLPDISFCPPDFCTLGGGQTNSTNSPLSTWTIDMGLQHWFVECLLSRICADWAGNPDDHRRSGGYAILSRICADWAGNPDDHRRSGGYAILSRQFLARRNLMPLPNYFGSKSLLCEFEI